MILTLFLRILVKLTPVLPSTEATKAIHTQPARASTSTTTKNHSSKTDDTHTNSSDNSNKRRKIAKEEREPLVSKRKFVSKVI
jgi:hypothetical protein